MLYLRLHADITGVVNGKRITRPTALTIADELTVLNAVPGDAERPTQARVYERVWNRKLRRMDHVPMLVVQDSMTVVEVLGEGDTEHVIPADALTHYGSPLPREDH